MKALIVLQWEKNGETIKKLPVWRKDFLSRLESLEEKSPFLHQVKGMAKDADMICVESEEEKKNLFFQYEENREFNQNTESLIVDNTIYSFIDGFGQVRN